MDDEAATTPPLPLELWRLILSPNLLSRAESAGVPLVELGSWRKDLAHDALLDQPRFRDNLLKEITIELNNTAEGRWKDNRRRSALGEMRSLVIRLPPLKSIALVVDGESTGVIWKMLDLVLLAPCSAEVRHLRLSTTFPAATGSVHRSACLHKLEKVATMRTLELQVDTLNPILDNFHATAALPLTSLSLFNGSLNLATTTLSLLRICKHSLRRLRVKGAARWTELVLDELSRDAAGYDLRALVVVGPGGNNENDQVALEEYEASSIAILALLPRLFASHPRMKSFALGPLVGLDTLCSRTPITSSAPSFLKTLPPTLEGIALWAYLKRNPTPILDFLRSRRCPQLRALQFAASSGRAVKLVGAQVGVTVNVSGRLTDPVWHI